MCGVQHNTTILLYKSICSAMNWKEIGDQIISSSIKLFDESILYIHTYYYTKNHTNTETDDIRDTDIGHQEHKSFE